MAAEAGAGYTPIVVTEESIPGYMKRMAIALESISGTTGDEENESYEGYLKRLVDALEALNGVTYVGTMEVKYRLGALALDFLIRMLMMESGSRFLMEDGTPLALEG